MDTLDDETWQPGGCFDKLARLAGIDGKTRTAWLLERVSPEVEKLAREIAEGRVTPKPGQVRALSLFLRRVRHG